MPNTMGARRSMIQFALQTLAPGPSTTPTHTDDVSAHAAVGVVGALLSHIARTPATAATAGKVVVATFTDFLARVESTVSAYTATRSTDAADSCAVAPLLALLALVLEGGASLWKRGQFVHLTDKLSTLLVAAVSTAPRSPPHAHTMVRHTLHHSPCLNLFQKGCCSAGVPCCPLWHVV